MMEAVFLAVTAPEETLWVVSLGIGAVVIAVVILLLTFLVKLLNVIDTNVAEVWATATRLAANTATIWQVNTAANTLERVKQEALVHDQLLGS